MKHFLHQATDLRCRSRGAPRARNALILFALAVPLAAAAAPASAADLKIGFVNLESVIRQSRYIRGEVAEIEAKARGIQDDIDQATGRYRRLAQLLEEQRSILSEKEVSERRNDILQLRSKIEDLRYELDKLLRHSREAALDPAVQRALKIVEEIGKRDKYDLILHGDTILFAAQRIDLTETVIEQLDANLPTAAAPDEPQGRTPVIE